MSRKRQSGIWLQLQPTVIKHAVGPMAGPNTIDIIKDPHKDDLDDLVVDLSNNIKERFFASLSNDKTNTVIDLGYLLVSQTMPSNPLSLS